MLTVDVNIEILKRVRVKIGVHAEWFDAMIEWHLQPRLPKSRIVELLVRDRGVSGKAMLSVNGQGFGAGRRENREGCLITSWQVGRDNLKAGVNELIAWVEKKERPPFCADVEVGLAEEDPESVFPDPRPTSQWSLAVRLGLGFDPRRDTWKVEVEKSAARVGVWLAQEVHDDFSITVAAGQGLDWLLILVELLKKIWELVKEKREELLRELEREAEYHERAKRIERDLDDLDRYQRLHRRLEKAIRGKDSLTLIEAPPELEAVPTARRAIPEVRPIDDSVRQAPPPLRTKPAPSSSNPATNPYRVRPPREAARGMSWGCVIQLVLVAVVVGVGVWGYFAWRRGELGFLDNVFGDGRTNVKGDKVDVMLVVDATGSMQDHYGKLAANLQRLTEKLKAENRDLRFGVTIFRDRVDAPGEDPFVLTFGAEEFTRDLPELERRLKEVRADGGGDPAESGFDGLAFAARRSFRPDAARVLVLITDDAPRVPDKDMQSAEQTATVLRRAGIHQLHLIMPPTAQGYADVQALLGANGGANANLNTGMDRVLDEIGDAIVGRFPKGG